MMTHSLWKSILKIFHYWLVDLVLEPRSASTWSQECALVCSAMFLKESSVSLALLGRIEMGAIVL